MQKTISAPPRIARPPVGVTPTVLKKSLPAQKAPAQPTRKSNSRRTIVKFGALLGSLCLIAAMLMTFSTTPSLATPAQPHPARCCAAPGLVESESGLLRLAFEASGKIKKVYVGEGQSVTRGQLLAELENDVEAARVSSAKADLKQAQSNAMVLEADLEGSFRRARFEADRCAAELALLKAGPRPEEIARARADAMAAEADELRAGEDAQKYNDPKGLSSGAWSLQVRDNYRRAAEAAKARHDAATEVLRALENGSRKEDIDRAEAALGSASAERQRIESTRELRIQSAREQTSAAQAHLSEAEALFEKTRLHAPIDGKVVWKYHSGGETLNTLAPDAVVAVADCSHLRVRAEVDEADVGLIKMGQNVNVAADSLPGHSFHGRVIQVGCSAGQKKFSTGDAKEKMDVNVVEVLVQLEQSATLKLGVRVTTYYESAK